MATIYTRTQLLAELYSKENTLARFQALIDGDLVSHKARGTLAEDIEELKIEIAELQRQLATMP